MKLQNKPIPLEDKTPDRGFKGTDKAVLEVSSVELAGADYLEIVVDGVLKATVRVSAEAL